MNFFIPFDLTGELKLTEGGTPCFHIICDATLLREPMNYVSRRYTTRKYVEIRLDDKLFLLYVNVRIIAYNVSSTYIYRFLHTHDSYNYRAYDSLYHGVAWYNR